MVRTVAFLAGGTILSFSDAVNSCFRGHGVAKTAIAPSGVAKNGFTAPRE
jgi:hypothetical protein